MSSAVVLSFVWCVFLGVIVTGEWDESIQGYEKELSDVIITTALGKVRGTYLTSQDGRNFYAFRGIRYAQPPIGKLRFQAPLPIEQWSEIFDATVDGPMCPQPAANSADVSEDCLRVNIYTKQLPSEQNPNVRRPVIVYFHPGGLYSLSSQSKNFAGPQYLMDRNIVLVTFNYRLGSLGFASTGTRDAPGNAGFKDQVLLLRWVRLHISRFGGDPKSVTAMGYGAGAVGVVLHMVSPMSKNLFHKAIVMSGSATAQWKLPEDQLELARKQAFLLGCQKNRTREMVECMREKHPLLYANTVPSMFECGGSAPFLLWKPVVEADFGQERFLIEDPVKSYQNGKFMKIPIITGITKDEFVGPALTMLENQETRSELNNKFYTHAPTCFLYDKNNPHVKNITDQLRKFYLGSGSLHHKRSVDGLSQLFADASTVFGVHRFVHLAARLTKVYYYRFAYSGRSSHIVYPDDDVPYGVVHHDDLLYLFVESTITKMFTEDDEEYRTVQKMTRMWTAFANKGDPNKPNDEYLRGIRWRPFSFRKEQYLDIGDELLMKEHLYAERMDLWKKLFPLEWVRRQSKNDVENYDYPADEDLVQ